MQTLPADQQQLQLSALDVLLRHPELSSDPLLVCSAARVCSRWRAAVAASGAGVDIVMQGKEREPGTAVLEDFITIPQQPDMPFSEDDPQWVAYNTRLSGMTRKQTRLLAWLHPHGRLVRSISLADDYGMEFAEQLLQHLPGAAGGHPALALPRLQRFSAYNALLHILPDSLADLNLRAVPFGPDLQTLQPLTATLQRLTGLRALHLLFEAPTNGGLDLSPLQHMAHLTRLQVHNEFNTSEWSKLEQALPCLTAMQVLSLEYGGWPSDRTPWKLLLRRMTALRDLHVALVHPMLGEGCLQLPDQVTHVKFDCSCLEPSWPNLTHLGLERLQHLQLLMGSCMLVGMPGTPHALQQSTQLTRLHLCYERAYPAARDASWWGKMPGLVDLSILEDDFDPEYSWTAEAVHEVFAGIGRATSLTRLHLMVPVREEAGPVRVCKHLSGLTRLQELRLEWCEGYQQPRDCVHLSALQGLTKLELDALGDGVGDTAAVAMLLHMPRLRHVMLLDCELQTDAVLPVLADRSGLTYLELSCNPGFSEQLLADVATCRPCGGPSISSVLSQHLNG